ncbi:MAG: hypothetical protein HP497_10570 [Nitrospira sp.]|nr:hypothetical protein [Nitrospira sp.]
MAIAGELIMQKQLGKTKPVRGKSSRKSAHKPGKTKSNVSSKPLVRRNRRAYVPSAAAAAVPEGSTTPTEGNTITLPSRALVLWENQAYVPSAAAAVVLEGPTTPMEGDTTTLALRALVLRKNQAYVPSAAAAASSQGWASALGKYWGRETIDKEKVLTIMMLPFVAWHAYQTRLQQRRNAMQMLVRGCVVRPADVDLHYITSVRKLGICSEAPDSQPFRDMELTFCPVPLAAEMRARGKYLLQWLRHELAAKYLPKLWKAVEAENRWCNLSGDQTQQAKDRQDKDTQSSAMIRIIKTLGVKIGLKSFFLHQHHISLNAPSGYHGEVEPIGLTDTGNLKSPSTPRGSVAPHAGG